MNQRIRKLAARADAYADTFCMSTETLPDGQTWTTLRDEKFAELLLREAANVADDNFDAGSCPVGYFILKHFGVEL